MWTGFPSDKSLGYFPPTLRVENLADTLRINHDLRETLVEERTLAGPFVVGDRA
jgi:hypothetical protein